MDVWAKSEEIHLKRSCDVLMNGLPETIMPLVMAGLKGKACKYTEYSFNTKSCETNVTKLYRGK